MSDATATPADLAADESMAGGRWWYLIAAVPAVYGAMLFLAPVFTMSVAFGEPVVTSGLLLSPELVLLVLGAPALLVTLALPIAIHRDLATVAPNADDWDPPHDAWVLLGALGIFIPGFAWIVSGYYLYRRATTVGLS